MSNRIFSFAVRRPALFYLSFSILLMADFLLLRENAIIESHDVLNNAIPYLKALTDLIKQHGIIGWFSSWGGGVPALNSLYCWWRPETLLYFLVSPFWVYVIQHGLATFVAGFGSYKFFHEVEGLSAGASLAAGIIFTTSATNFVPEATAFAGVPLFLYCFDRWVLEKNSKKSILFILGCIYYLISANPILVQPYACLLHFTLCIRFVLSRRYTPKVFFYFLGAWIFYTLTQLPILFNFFLEYASAGRTRMAMPAPIGLNFLIPLADRNVFLLTITFLGLLSLYRFKQGRIYACWFLLAVPFRYLWGKAAAFLPFCGAFQCRVFEILPFIVTAMFAFAVDQFLTKDPKLQTLKRYKIPLFAASFLLALLYAPSPLNYPLVAASTLLALLLHRIYRRQEGTQRIFAVMLIGLCLFV